MSRLAHEIPLMVTLAVLALSPAAPAWAQAQSGEPAETPSAEVPPEGDDASARAHFQAATDAFQIADYAAARREYELAFELSGRPQMMYQLYLCDERLGELDGAIRWLERYLLEVEDVPRRDTLVTRLATMRERAARENAPDVQPDPEPDPEPEPEPEPELAQAVEAPVAALQPGDPAPNEPLVGTGIALLGVAALGFLGSATTGGLGLREQARLEEECAFDVCPGALRTVRDDARGLFLVADVLWVSSLVVAASGALVTVLGLTLNDEGSP